MLPETRELRGLSEMETATIHKVLCFICHQEVDAEMVVMVNALHEDMICLCKKHLRPDFEAEYNQGTLIR